MVMTQKMKVELISLSSYQKIAGWSNIGQPAENDDKWDCLLEFVTKQKLHYSWRSLNTHKV